MNHYISTNVSFCTPHLRGILTFIRSVSPAIFFSKRVDYSYTKTNLSSQNKNVILNTERKVLSISLEKKKSKFLFTFVPIFVTAFTLHYNSI